MTCRRSPSSSATKTARGSIVWIPASLEYSDSSFFSVSILNDSTNQENKLHGKVYLCLRARLDYDSAVHPSVIGTGVGVSSRGGEGKRVAYSWIEVPAVEGSTH